MSHVNPDGEVATVVERPQSVLCEQPRKRRLGDGAVKPAGDGPKAESLAPGAARGPGRRSRYVPAAVRAAVHRPCLASPSVAPKGILKYDNYCDVLKCRTTYIMSSWTSVPGA